MPWEKLVTEEIRPLGTDDAAEFHALRLRGLSESPEAFGMSFAEDVATPLEAVAERLTPSRAPTGRVVVGAFIDGVLVGVVGCGQDARLKSRHRAVIWGMYVAPEARGRGVGRRLIDRVISEARTWPDVERLFLTVTERSHAARALYGAVGFQPFGREEDGLRQDGYRDVLEYLSLTIRP